MSSAKREYFTFDLRGLRAALAAHAAADGFTESDVVRCALAVTLGKDQGLLEQPPTVNNDRPPPSTQVKLSVRIARHSAFQLDRNARVAGLSRGAYLSRLIAGAPAVLAAADRAAASSALSASSAELALLSRDLYHLTQLLRQGDVQAARAYRERLDSVNDEVQMHLDKAAAVLAQLTPGKAGSGRLPSPFFHSRSD